MASSHYPALRDGLLDLASSVITSPSDLKPRINAIWTPTFPSDASFAPSDIASAFDTNHRVDQARLEAKNAGQVYTISDEDGRIVDSLNRKMDMMRLMLDLIGRDLVTKPLCSEEMDPTAEAFSESFEYRLHLLLKFYEAVYEVYPDALLLEPGALFIPLLEDLVELVPVDQWRSLWTWIEHNSYRFTRNMPASRGKALPLLRLINVFLRSLPRTPEDLLFRGRIHQFASGVISVADKSSINLRGDYGEIATKWEEEECKELDAASKDDDEDVEMKGEEIETKDEDPEAKLKSPKPDQPEFYPTLWSLQSYFSYPPSLAGPSLADSKTPFDDFKTKADLVLPKLFEQTQKEKDLMGKEQEQAGTKRKRGHDEDDQEGKEFFHPKYLTGRRLFEYELADQSFRRQVLVQFCVLFQFLLNLTPTSASKQAFTGMPKDFRLDEEKEIWVKSKAQAIRDELKRMTPDGARFEEIVLTIIKQERHYAAWKNDQCPEGVFEVPPMDPRWGEEGIRGWKRRKLPPKRILHAVGSNNLSTLWRDGYENIDELKRWKRPSSVRSIGENVREIEASIADDRAMGQTPDDEAFKTKNQLEWRALRAASRTHLRSFTVLQKKREIGLLNAELAREEKQKMLGTATPAACASTPSAKGDEDEKMEESTPGGVVEAEMRTAVVAEAVGEA